MNLVRNALEAMTKRGKVVVRTCAIESGFALEIQDTGKGMPEEVMRKLGTPFVTTKETGQDWGCRYVIALRADMGQ